MPQMPPSNELLVALSLFFATFVYEDGATLLAAALTQVGKLDTRLGLVSVFLGIWIGDMGLYAVGSGIGQRVLGPRWLGRFIPEKKLRHAQTWFSRRGVWALVISRIIPGSRLPLYFATGALRFSPRKFAGVTGICAAAWVSVIFVMGSLAVKTLHGPRGIALILIAAVALATVYVFGKLWRRRVSSIWQSLRKYQRWEFWPAWLFYPPVAAMCAWFGLRYGGLALPTVANPAFRNGGIVGESKIEPLQWLGESAPDFTADAYLIPLGEINQRFERFRLICQEFEISFPLVLKPNVGQRGEGFKLIYTLDEAEAYLAQVTSAIVLQRYVNAPKEAGIFYYRFPGDTHGRIFAITEKIFPVLTGDGVRTFEQLLLEDKRASLIAHIYLDRFRHLQHVVVASGQEIRLVEAGNHCQGCIFQDGSHLTTEKLLQKIDAISQSLPGFFVGRYDIRYSDNDDLKRGENFKIIELNGAASEATNIYDSRNSLWSAYRTLYQQWKLVYAIGRANKNRGHKPSGISDVIVDWKQYRSIASAYPAAD